MISLKTFAHLTFIICITSTIAQIDDSNCRLTIVESIPVNMTYSSGSPTHPSTFNTFVWIIGNTTSHLNISSFYWAMLGRDTNNEQYPTAMEGEAVFKALILSSALKRFSISIVNNGNQEETLPNSLDLSYMKDAGADVRYLQVQRLLGSGILHTKLWTSDDVHGYVGSANMDWRSLTEVKELGVYLHECPTLVGDLVKLQGIYRALSGPNSSIPTQWPASFETKFNKENPLHMTINGADSLMYFAASPPQFMTPKRTAGDVAIPDVISKANKFVFIAVMDYFPLEVDYSDKQQNTFWPVIDDALRKAAIDHHIEVRLLISLWKHTNPAMLNYLKSLLALRDDRTNVNVNIKLFMVPGYQNSSIPYARVNHNKYMVTDNVAFIGTSNWSGDYFTHTCGISLVLEEPISSTEGIRGQLEAIFRRDWNSTYARYLTV